MLYKLNSLQYSELTDIANTHDCGSVYPLSVAEGIQEGEIFANSVKGYDKVLFWTHSGFAYLSGNVDEYFLEDIYELMVNRTKANTRRFLLMTRTSWAFSAAVSSKEIDIGIETSSKYRQQGLGIIVAKRMIQYVFEQGKKPVWACHYKNVASEKMAEKLGFIKVSECSIIKN